LSDLKMDVTALDNKFGIDNVVVFDKKPNDQVVVKITNDFAQAEIMLQGAHLIHWQPVDEEAVIWLSEDALFQHEKSIRGGVPVCWPWFGAHAGNESFPAHGYARTVPWELLDITQLTDGRTQLDFRLIENSKTRQLWSHNTELNITYVIGRDLEINLITRNKGNSPVVLSEALHTYFKVGDVSKVSVTGLDGCHYLDKLEDFADKKQIDAIYVNEEVDRIYIDTSSEVCINDPVLNRRIVIRKEGSNSTVVWNPWKDTAAKMGDLGQDGYLNMLCIESANAAANALSLGAGCTHPLNVKYSVDKLNTN